MGTSQSSNGSPSGVPMVPPWVPDLDTTGDFTPPLDDDVLLFPASPNPSPIQPVLQIAPRGRFSASKTNLGRYAQSGDSAGMKRAVGQYVRKGCGGTRTAVRRLGGTVRNAGALYEILTPGTDRRAAFERQLDRPLLERRTQKEIIDAVIEAVQPVDGTLDAEANRPSIADALAELYERFPDADLFNLSVEERMFAIERYIAHDVYRRVFLDLGKTVQDKAPTPLVAVQRLKEMRVYIKETLSAEFRKVYQQGQELTGRIVSAIARTALTNTFAVFESDGL